MTTRALGGYAPGTCEGFSQRAGLPITVESDSEGTQRDEPFLANAPRAINNRLIF